MSTAFRLTTRHKWAAPSVGLFKLNSDAFCCGDGVTGLGEVVRGCNDDGLVATCLKIQGEMGVDVAEAMAARHLVVIAIDSGFNKLILESDCRLILVRCRQYDFQAPQKRSTTTCNHTSK